jgi:hypothetical protein
MLETRAALRNLLWAPWASNWYTAEPVAKKTVHMY